MLAAIPQILLELYEFFDHFTPLFAIYRETSIRFCEFIFYSLLATFANYLAKTAKIAVTIEWKYMRARVAGVERGDMKYALYAILRGFVAAKIGVPAWMPPRVVKSVCYAVVEAIFGSLPHYLIFIIGIMIIGNILKINN